MSRRSPRAIAAAVLGLLREKVRPRSTVPFDQRPGESSQEIVQLDPVEFVKWAYQTLLDRPADPRGIEIYAGAIQKGALTREGVLIELLTCQEFNNRFQNREKYPAGHFFSAIPSQEDRARFLENGPSTVPVIDVDLRHDAQFELLQQLKPYYDSCPLPEQPQPGFRYHFDNPAYAYSDGMLLHTMIRHIKPQRIIEIGCGYSSTVMMDTNDRFFDGQIDIRFIDPYPQLLHKLMLPGDRQRYEILPDPIQAADLSIFEALDANDILFIDSTHVTKLGSDVNREFFDILPRLKPGVWVHIHDISWPFEYAREWIEEGRAWNELYLVRAFLAYNNTFPIRLFSAYLHEQPDTAAWLEREMPLTRKNCGGQLWIQRVGDG